MVSLQGKIEFTNGVFELNNRNLIELNLNFFSLNDISLPNYGIISNEGSLSFNDYDKTIEKNNKLGLLKTNVPISCFLINSVEKIEETKGNWYSEKWQYDNNNNKVNANWILQFDPWADGPTVVASAEWNITALLPDVPANAGIEAAEWVSNEFVAGKLFDDNTGAPFNPENYPKATANGVFFVAFEKNGHVYAFVLNNDGSAQRIADIDPGIGGAMALDFDTYENTLWVAADDGYDNMTAKINFNGTNTPKVTLVKPAAGIDIARNNEGFAIADPEYTIEGLRPVYHFMDGATSGDLTIS